MKTLEEETEILETMRKNPELFSREILGETPWYKQIEIMNAVRDYPRVAVKSANGVGKDWVAATIALWFLYTNCPSIVITTAPTERQIEKILWGEIRRKFYNAKYPLGGRCLNLQIQIEPNWYAVGFSTDNISQFQGFHQENILIIFSEAQGISSKIFEAAKGCLTSKNSRWLIIGNPITCFGDFYKAFQDQRWKKITISALESPNAAGKEEIPGLVSRAWIEERKEDWGEDNPLYQARVLGEFPKESEDSLIPFSWLEHAKERKIEGFSFDKVLGVDIARYGSDETVVCEFDGYTTSFPIIMHQAGTTEIAGAIISYLREKSGEDWPIFADDVGVGGGVVDILREQGYNVRSIVGNARSSKPEEFADLRSEMFFSLREKFRMNEISIPDDDKLIAQLAVLRFDYTQKGAFRVLSKEILRREGKGSPDRADALAMASFGWREGRVSKFTETGQGTLLYEYDPFEKI